MYSDRRSSVYEVGGRWYIAFLATGRPPGGGFGQTPGEGVTWKPGKPGALGSYVFALPRTTAASKKQ
jgi:hypothetical protein